MDLHPIPEMVGGLPNICGADDQVREVTLHKRPVFLHETNLQVSRLRAVFAIALHMQQPLIPAGGHDIHNADTISNLDFMVRNQGNGDNPISWAQWTGSVSDGDKCSSPNEHKSGYCTGPFGQDAGSTYNPGTAGR